jgi:hypothetical protein
MFRMVCHTGQQALSAKGAVDANDRAKSLSFHRPVDGRASDPEQVPILSQTITG